MKEWCISCGFSNEYLSIRPRFCGGCGLILNRASNPPVQKQESFSSSKPKRKSIFLDNEEEDDEDDFSDLQLDRASLANSVEAIVDKPRFPTFEDLAIHSATPRGEKYTRPEFKVEGGDIIQATRQECGRVQSSKEVGVSK